MKLDTESPDTLVLQIATKRLFNCYFCTYLYIVQETPAFLIAIYSPHLANALWTVFNEINERVMK